jgi:micrococcal nuclease
MGKSLESWTAKYSTRGSQNVYDCMALIARRRGQAFGQKAKQATSSLLFGKDVRIESHGRDKHRRTLGTVFDGDLNVNQELVKEGWCWWFRKFVPKDPTLKQLEQEVKDAKKGLWADPNPVPPWLYRRLEFGAYP